MRSSLVSVIVLTAVLGLPLAAAAQPDEQAATTPPAARPVKAGADSPDQAATTPIPRPMPPLFKSLNNVQIELTITDQIGSSPAQKKTISMIAASGTWGKIRAAGAARPNDRSAVVPVGLNVDARPFVTGPEGVVQVELTIGYNPLDPLAADRTEPSGQARPTDVNQSMTVVLQSGKPLIVSQAADPVSDRKIIVEVKATILK